MQNLEAELKAAGLEVIPWRLKSIHLDSEGNETPEGTSELDGYLRSIYDPEVYKGATSNCTGSSAEIEEDRVLGGGNNVGKAVEKKSINNNASLVKKLTKHFLPFLEYRYFSNMLNDSSFHLLN